MYCEHCGKKIDEDSKFCEFCGTKLTKEEPKKEKFQKEKNPNETKILIVIMLIAIFGFIFYQELKYFNSPENAINSFLKDYKNKNYDSILENLNIESTPFTNAEILKTINKDLLNINDFKIIECKSDNSDTAKCEISYRTNKNGMDSSKTYRLRKKEEKRLGIFTEWIIENQDIEIQNDWVLFLPKDSTGALEGINLFDYRSIENDKNGYDAYKIPIIFKGNYNLEMTTNSGITLKSTVKVNGSNYTYQFNLKDISDEMRNSIKNLGSETIETFYQGIISKKKKEELESNYDISKILSDYETLKAEIESDITLKEFKIIEIKITGLELKEDGKLFITYQMNYQYTFDYNSKEGTKSHSGESNDTFYITTKNTDLKEIEEIDSLVSYFSKKY